MVPGDGPTTPSDETPGKEGGEELSAEDLEDEVGAAGDEEDDGSEDEDEDDGDVEEVVFSDAPLPSLDEMRAALQWAFEGKFVPEGYLDRCAEHALLVQEGNRRMNLTRIADPREVAAKHYYDSWRATELLPLMGRAVLDLGTGAGYPGIPIALAEPDARFVLIDSTRKKADFLASCIETMGLTHVSAVCDRAEEHLARNRYDVVVMRAISSVRENVRLLRKVRHSFMDLLMLKGPSWSREVRAGEREAERLGFKLETVWEHDLPGEMGKRAVLVYRAPGGQGR